MIDITARIHPLAHVEDSTVAIGAHTRVWQFASVIRGSEIGENCSIGSSAVVDGARIGRGCLIGSGAFIPPGVLIDDDVFVGPGVKFCNDLWPSTSKEGWFDIRDLTKGDRVVVHIQEGASIGAGAIIMPGVVIGARAMIAAGAVVTRYVLADRVFQRDGSHVEIDPIRKPSRMREVL